jgi:hypothetical protein
VGITPPVVVLRIAVLASTSLDVVVPVGFVVVVSPEVKRTNEIESTLTVAEGLELKVDVLGVIAVVMVFSAVGLVVRNMAVPSTSSVSMTADDSNEVWKMEDR